MPVNVPRMRCPVCRMWIDAPRSATKVPDHTAPGEKGTCNGSGRSPAGRRGPR
jgi:hypothetical protein